MFLDFRTAVQIFCPEAGTGTHSSLSTCEWHTRSGPDTDTRMWSFACQGNWGLGPGAWDLSEVLGALCKPAFEPLESADLKILGLKMVILVGIRLC